MDEIVIPTIDLDTDDHNSTVEAIRNACIEYGFFYITGYDKKFNNINTDAVLEQSKLFFNIPLHEKQNVYDPVLTRGYTGMGEETLDPNNQSCGDTKEGFYISLDILKTDPLYNPKKFYGPNQWPTKDKCPSLLNPEQFKRTMEEYLINMIQLSNHIVHLLAESLHLQSTYFDSAFENPMPFIRLLHYDSIKSNINEKIFACGAHSDYGMMTLLLTDMEDGLEIYDKKRKVWIPVPPKQNHFVVNLGDMLERWTNGLYTSTIHRVINKSGNERYSIPFFYEPNYDTIVECLPTCCNNDDDNPPKYPPITSGEHLLSKYKQTHADFKREE